MAVLFNPKAKRVAVIDLGSNTARLIVMGSVPGYAYRLEDEISYHRTGTPKRKRFKQLAEVSLPRPGRFSLN
jgi:exopolyphosphatase/pppGpp-phosphohydrolase